MSSDAGSRRAAPKQKKTYGKGVKSHLSGWFGRDLWSAVEPTVVSRKKNGDKRVTAEDDELAEKQLVDEQKQRLSSDTDKSVDGGVKLTAPVTVVQEAPVTEAAVLDEVEVREVKVLGDGDFTDLEAEIDGILESMGKLDVQTSHDQTATTIATIDLTNGAAELDPEARSIYSLSSVQFKENSDKENEEPQSTPPLPPIHNGVRSFRRKPPASAENSPRDVLRERPVSPDGFTVLESPARKNGVRKRGARRSVISTQSPAPSPLREEGKKGLQGGGDEGEMENPITVWEDEGMGAIRVGPLVNLLGRKASRVELLEIPDSEDEGEEEDVAAIVVEPVYSQLSEESPSKVLDEEDKGLPVIDLEEVCSARVSEKSHEEGPVSSAGSLSTEHLLRLCTNASILDFEEYINSLAETSSIRKLGEASYSEVFLQSTPGSLTTTVLKIIPFGGLDQCELESIIQEVRITKAMGDIEGFIGFRGAFVVQGYFPQLLMDEWGIYDEERGSENERPDFYAEDQQFAIICLENGGTDLEHFDLEGWEEAWGVFWQVTLALARGEKERDFEHRDLHYGNIVIQRVSDDNDSAEELLGELSLQDSDSEQPKKEPTGVKQGGTKLDVALIDYTLSRAVCGNGEDGDVSVEFAPLDDNALFTGRGDYQFDIYRFMRSHLRTGLADPSEEWIDWNVYTPKTNTYWLHYLTNILLNRKQIPRPAARGKNAATGEQRKCYKNLETVTKVLDPRKRKFGKDQVDCGSAVEFVEWAVKEGISEKGI
ncbi:unnamed protein product [Tuber aestivum]|uniref:non-specific serine/threonine protein kinase n=1 Tax=Tuber aestivum TaxID=59557 RepID=A0A292PTR9_9PEZI|nr:unnamed protein product [Tuber aestivum]